MKRVFWNLCVVLVFLTICGAAYSLTSTKIKDILDHPRDYENKDVTINGTVTNTVSLLLIKYYEIQDATGSIKIITDKLLPSRGEKVTVTGRMAVVELGTERWVMLRESPSDYPGQYFGSEKHDDLTDNDQRSKY